MPDKVKECLKRWISQNSGKDFKVIASSLASVQFQKRKQGRAVWNIALSQPVLFFYWNRRFGSYIFLVVLGFIDNFVNSAAVSFIRIPLLSIVNKAQVSWSLIYPFFKFNSGKYSKQCIHFDLKLERMQHLQLIYVTLVTCKIRAGII